MSSTHCGCHYLGSDKHILIFIAYLKRLRGMQAKAKKYSHMLENTQLHFLGKKCVKRETVASTSNHQNSKWFRKKIINWGFSSNSAYLGSAFKKCVKK